MEHTPTPMPAEKVIEREFLEIRAKILELAASFDRMDRGEGMASREHLQLIHKGLKILEEKEPNRAERVQLLFSRKYTSQWRSEFGI